MKELILKNIGRKAVILVSLLLLTTSPSLLRASVENIEFNVLNNRDGLSNSQVNAILQDDKGFVWLGTQAGLNRFDGFRFKKFLYDNVDKHSLPNNSIDDIQQDHLGNLWVHTATGYCIYDYKEEQFNRNVDVWLKERGITGYVSKIFIDSRKDMWIVVSGKGCYFLGKGKKTPHLFAFSNQKGTMPLKEVSNIRELGGTVMLSFVNGTLARIDGVHRHVMWVNDYLPHHFQLREDGAFVSIDSRGNYWVVTNGRTFVYAVAQRRWYDNMAEFVKSQGIDMPADRKLLVRDIAKGKDGKLWIATDHDGLVIIDYARKSYRQYLKGDDRKGGLPDNALQRLYVDRNGAVWIGTYKNGVAFHSPSFTRFSTIPLGDICTITQDRKGNIWCGTNDAGIVSYNPKTGQSVHYGREQTGLRSDVVVSSVTMQDGTMYFGTFNGGMVRYKDGQWKTYEATDGGLSSNSIWSLASCQQDGTGKLLIATLGGGFQVMDTQTETFSTYNTSNSKIANNYLGSVSLTKDQGVLLGSSQNFSVFNLRTKQFTNYDRTKDGQSFISPSINDAVMDSRGIFWLATPAGIIMYDPKSGQKEWINELNGTQGTVGCSVIEGKDYTMWLVSEFIVTHVKINKAEDGNWELKMTSYNDLDGLQDKQFNYRSAYLSPNGDIILGGQGGINIIHPQSERHAATHAKVLFSGLVLFDHPLRAGEEYEGKVVLDEALDISRELELSHKDNAFTVQLASSDVVVPSRSRFLYCMKGVSDKWLMTANGRPEVTFTNLSPGSYTLLVKVVNGDGTVNEEVSELKIRIRPPFYLSSWAILIYFLLICALLYEYRRRMLEKQREKFEHERMEESIRKTRELNELKLNFFTNVSHELRTPLTLIISPLANLIKEEGDEGKKRKLELIHRNATRLLALVNQILDFRKFDQNKEKLNLSRMDIVSFVDNICNSFRILGNGNITLSFHPTLPKLLMAFDADKVGKIVNNLLSNAYKFTPDGGKIDVTINVVLQHEVEGVNHDMLRITVADTGKGISDEEKRHVFERFYQVNGTEMQPYGGSGIGLNLVKKFAQLHGGKASVADNPGGGTVFIVDLPIEQANKEPMEKKQADKSAVPAPSLSSDARQTEVQPAGTPQKESHPSGKHTVLLVDDSDDFREFMRDVLTDYEVVEAVNGEDAWQKIQEHHPDVILSDVMMPVMDGNALCKLVKGNTETASIPFVMLTARLAQEHKIEGMENGADDYITKPFDVDMLNLRIKSLLRLSGTSSTSDDKETATGEYTLSEGDRKFIKAVDDYIQDNLSNAETSVESMSAHLFISRVQLYKRMVSLTGTTPSEYLRAKRIKQATELLHSGDYSVSEIAYRVGFNNPRYFSKYFQEAYGMTPSQYKKKKD